MSSVNMLLSDFSAFGTGGNNEVRDLMERIYQSYCKKLSEKASFRKKLQMKTKEFKEVVANVS